MASASASSQNPASDQMRNWLIGGALLMITLLRSAAVIITPLELGVEPNPRFWLLYQTPADCLDHRSYSLDIWASHMGSAVASLLDTSDHSLIVMAGSVMAFWATDWPVGRPDLDQLAGHRARQFPYIH